MKIIEIQKTDIGSSDYLKVSFRINKNFLFLQDYFFVPEQQTFYSAYRSAAAH